MAVKMIDCAKICMAGKYPAPQSPSVWQSDGGATPRKRGIGAEELAEASVDTGAKLTASFAVPAATGLVADVPTKTGNCADSSTVGFESRTSYTAYVDPL